MKQKLKPETWVGIFLIAGILMIIGVILGFGNIKTSKEQTYPINIIFKDAAGLIKDSQLRLGGVTVGKVTKAPELLPSGNEVMLEASILSGVKIQEGSVFRVDMQNILGDKYIDIVPPARPTHEYIPPHATIIGQPESDFSKIKNNAVGATEEILKILKQIEKNSDNIDEAILNIGEAAKGLAQTTKLINEGILSRENLRHLNSVLAQMNKAGEQLPGLMEETRSSVAAMKDTVRCPQTHCRSGRKAQQPGPRHQGNPPHADRPAQGFRANRLRHGGRPEKPGLPGAAHVRCALPRQCPGIHP
ncbi:MAG: MlaD family protein [Akkermansia sp.]